MKTTALHTVWAVVAHLHGGGSHVATAIDDDGTEYPDIYRTKTEAQQEVADLIAERLILFREDAASYGDLETALDCGFDAVEASIDADEMVFLGGKLQGQLPPAILERIASAVRGTTDPQPNQFRTVTPANPEQL